MVSSFDHPNIISFVGFCDDAEEMIIVYEYAEGGSLDRYLQKHADKKRHLTWTQRLQICLGAARGLDYLHSGLGEEIRVVHRDLKSANILLDANLEAKICDFGLSRYGPRNQPHTKFITKIAGTRFYIDPVSNERGVFSKESDIYSYGVVMFESSSGSLVYLPRHFGDAKPQNLINVVRSYYDEEDGLDKLIDPIIKGDIKMKSFHMFNEIAHECLNMKLKQRPTLSTIIQKIEQALNIQLDHKASLTASLGRRNLESLKISLEEIKLATRDFSPDLCMITSNEFCTVYRGEFCSRSVAIKVLRRKRYQQEDKFRKELQMMFSFQHQNIMPLIGYCDERNKKIIIHDYNVNESLFEHLLDLVKSLRLTWAQRLKICVGVARGLAYLNVKLGKNNKVIHGHINSQSILLDTNMDAKICLFDWSKQGPIDHTHEDVYSYGQMLFEMWTGKRYDHQFLVSGNRQDLRSLLNNTRYQLAQAIDMNIKDQINSRCFDQFQRIIYRCIRDRLIGRRIEDILKMIEDAAKYQGLAL